MCNVSQSKNHWRFIMVEYRTEEDTLGPVKIPADALWGPQTE